MQCDVQAITVGAGPYGLSIAAHLQAYKIRQLIFGTPMKTWRDHMPADMLLKSDGFASNLYEPTNEFTLKAYCAAHSIAYHDTNLPVSLQTFVNYSLAFQANYVSHLDERMVTSINRQEAGFKVTLADGQELTARHVIIAAGITHFPYVPENLRDLPSDLASHGSAHSNLDKFKARSITVVGGGASAVDMAVLLYEAGAKVNLLARRSAIRFHNPPSSKPRSLWQRLRTPSSGLGPGLKSRFFCEAPGIFRHFPLGRRLQIVERHLGPAPGWPMRDRLLGKVPLELGIRDLQAEPMNGMLCLRFLDSKGIQREHLTEHVIAATGYKVDTNRLEFLSEEIRQMLISEGTSPKLSANFESSVPGLYFAGIAAATSFGPLMRFAFGARYAARTITKHVSKRAARHIGS